jgi:glucose-1-phosphate thymidylyltransferase
MASDFARVEFFFVQQNSQQRRFASSVASHETDFHVVNDRDIRAIKQPLVTIRFVGVANLNQNCHGNSINKRSAKDDGKMTKRFRKGLLGVIVAVPTNRRPVHPPLFASFDRRRLEISGCGGASSRHAAAGGPVTDDSNQRRHITLNSDRSVDFGRVGERIPPGCLRSSLGDEPLARRPNLTHARQPYYHSLLCCHSSAQLFSMSVLLFEDSFVDRLQPITFCRPAYAIHCGGLRLVEVVRRLALSIAAESRPHLSDLQETSFPELSPRGADDRRVLLNARLVPDLELVPILRVLLDQQDTGAVWIEDQLALAILPQNNPLANSVEGRNISSLIRESRISELLLPDEMREHIALLEYPHSVIAEHRRVLANNLQVRAATEEFTEIQPSVYVKDNVTLGPFVVCETSGGPILLESGAEVGPFSILIGPLSIGENSTIHPRSSMHPYVSTGSTVKIGGEVDSSIVESYSNKQHHGYLGHSYLGSWVNLGAGTSNSNLKNTYGQVNMTIAGHKVPTGMRLMGCVIGDYTKTAINTSILTGRTIGVASMLYGFVAQDVPSFVNYAHQFGDITSVSLAAAVTMQQRMFARRQVVHRPADEELMTRVYEQTAAEREGLSCRPPKLV